MNLKSIDDIKTATKLLELYLKANHTDIMPDKFIEEIQSMIDQAQLALLKKIRQRVDEIPVYEHSYLEFADIMDCLDEIKKEIE